MDGSKCLVTMMTMIKKMMMLDTSANSELKTAKPDPILAFTLVLLSKLWYDGADDADFNDDDGDGDVDDKIGEDDDGGFTVVDGLGHKLMFVIFPDLENGGIS